MRADTESGAEQKQNIYLFHNVGGSATYRSALICFFPADND